MKERFDLYVQNYDITDPMIKGKWEHCYHVMEKAIYLSAATKFIRRRYVTSASDWITT